MHPYKLMLAGVFTLAMSFNHTFAQTAKPVAKPKSTAKPAAAKQTLSPPEKITTVEGITEYKLANGLIVLLFPDPSKPTVTVNITYLVGSRMESQGEYGMAHLLEHMGFKGSTHHPDIDQEMTAHGAFNNASTSYDRTNYFEILTASDENLKWALDMEADRMVNSFISQKDLSSEFSVVRNEFEMGENSPGEVLEERVLSSAYLWHNYGKSTIGSKEDIEKVPAEKLKVFYKKYYQPDNAVLMIVGKIDEAKTLQLVNQYFGVIPKPKRVLEQPYTVEPVQDGERMVELSRVGDVQEAAAGYHICAGSHPDFAPISVLSEVLTNQPSGRLYKALVETKKASSVSSDVYGLKDPGYIYFSAEVLKEKSLNDANSTMKNLLDSLSFNPVTDEEVDRAKSKLMKDIDLEFNNATRIGLEMSEYIAQGDWRLFFITRDRIEKVTAADVNRVAKDYFKPSNRTVGLFIPDAKPDRAEIPATPDVTAMTKDYKGKKALADAETFDASPANIDSRTHKGKLDGGAQYAFLSKTTRGNNVTVSITLRVGTDKSLDNKAVIADYTADMLNKGTTTKSRQEINDAFNKLKASVNINGSGQHVSVQVTTTKDNLVNTLKLVTEILRQPSFPANEFDKLKDQNLTEIESQKSEPQALAGNVFSRLTSNYSKNDFRYTMTFEEEAEAYKKATVEEAKQFYHDYYNSAAATVSIVGDFDEAPALNELKMMLADWQSPQKYKHAEKPFFDIAPKNEKVNTPDKKNAMLMAGINLKLKDNDAAYPALIMGNFMLGGGFLNSRLALRIRQKEGISYYVASWIEGDAIDEVGSFGSVAIYNPENSEKLVTAYKEEIDKVLKDGYTEAELKDAKTGYLQQKKIALAQDGYLTNILSNNLYLNRTMQWEADQDKKVEALTVEDVNAAMRKFIHPEKITYVQAGDFKTK